jgi:BASS family bile acid:Na+ symporter
MLEGTLLNSWDIAKSLLAIMLLPLALALSIKASFPRIAARLQPYAAKTPQYFNSRAAGYCNRFI